MSSTAISSANLVIRGLSLPLLNFVHCVQCTLYIIQYTRSWQWSQGLCNNFNNPIVELPVPPLPPGGGGGGGILRTTTTLPVVIQGYKSGSFLTEQEADFSNVIRFFKTLTLNKFPHFSFLKKRKPNSFVKKTC